MMPHKQTINPNEVSKFHANAQRWWDLQGPFKTLHELNPVRLALIESFGTVNQQSILDVGCGGGILSEALAYKGAHVVGIDADPASIATAIHHAEALNLKLSYLTTPIESYSGEIVDMITCFELLEHVSHPQTVLDHAARLLKPGGLLFLSTINRTLKAYLEAIVIAEYVLNLLPKQTHDYAKCIRPSELAAMARHSGFKIIDTVGLGYDPLRQVAYLRSNVQVNYIMVCQKL